MKKEKKKLGLIPRAILAGFILAIIAAFCVFLVLKAEHETSAIIKNNNDIKMQNMLYTMLPQGTINDKSKITCKIINKKGIGKNQKAYIIKNDGTIDGYIINYSTSKGYTNPLLLIAGLDKNFNIHRVDITLSKETPGIGDKAERKKSNFLDALSGSNINTKNFDVKKFGGDFDYITGATVTSRAVILSTYDLLKNIQDINFNELENCQESIKND